MEHEIKKLLENIHPKEINKMLETHLLGIKKDDKEKTVTLFVDKKYIMNELAKAENFGDLIKSVQKTYGEEYLTIIKLNIEDPNHEREKLIPHNIYYGA